MKPEKLERFVRQEWAMDGLGQGFSELRRGVNNHDTLLLAMSRCREVPSATKLLTKLNCSKLDSGSLSLFFFSGAQSPYLILKPNMKHSILDHTVQ